MHANVEVHYALIHTEHTVRNSLTEVRDGSERKDEDARKERATKLEHCIVLYLRT
jgi:hypothetical protein